MRNINKIIKQIRLDKGISRENFAKAIGISYVAYSKIEREEVSVNVDRLYAIADAVKMDASDILNYNTNEEREAGNIVYIPVKAQAGLLADIMDNINTVDCMNFSIPFFTQKDLYMIDVEGSSMSPTVSSGDYAIINKVKDLMNLKFGLPYVVESEDGRVVKRIYNSENPENFTLKSDNPVYHPYEIEKKSIRSIWEIRGFMSKDLSPRTI